MSLIPLSIGMAGLDFSPIFYLHGPLLVFIACPLLYYYYRAYLINQNKLTAIDFLHFIPFVIQVFLWYYFVLRQPGILDQGSYFLNLNKVDDSYKLQRKISGFVLSTIYFLVFIKMARDFHIKAKEEYSYTDKNTLRWFYFLMTTIYMIPFFSGLLAFIKLNNSGIYLTAVVLLSNFQMILIVMLRPEIHRGIHAFIPITLKKTSRLLPEHDMILLYKRLTTEITQKKLFLDHNLKLNDLSAMMDSNDSYVSQAINGVSKQSFFDLINSHRIEHAKVLLTDDSYSNYSIEAIGTESGFRSKSAFYNAFNKYCGMSPTEYKNKKVSE
jgi:AraC-like DNA-binding protein